MIGIVLQLIVSAVNPLVGIPSLINFILPLLIIPLLCLWYVVKIKKEWI